MPLDTVVGLGPGHIALDGDPALRRKWDTASPLQFSAHVSCAQMAGWIKKPLGTEVGLGPGHIVLDGDPVPSPKRGRGPSPILRVELENFEIGPEVRL